MSYSIINRSWIDDRNLEVLLGSGFKTSQDAFWARMTSGDLVVDSDTGLVVQDDDWLWEWEKQDENCYARRAQQVDRKYWISLMK